MPVHLPARRRRSLVAAVLAAATLLGTTGCSGMLKSAQDAAAVSTINDENHQYHGIFKLAFDRDPYGTAPVAVAKLAKTTSRIDAELLKKITGTEMATWFGSWNKDVTKAVSQRVTAAAQRNGVAVLVTYNIPHQDCGSYGRHESTDITAAQQRAWVQKFVAGLGKHRAVVIVEADALANTKCLTGAQKDERYTLIKSEVEKIRAQGSWAYIDAGHPGWHSAKVTAERLREAGVDEASGFSLNTGNTHSTHDNIAYGTTISRLDGDAHFVIDTSRNGVPTTSSKWCNAEGLGLGAKPTAVTGSDLVDAYLWIKNPGTSDGTCRGGLAAGQWMQSYAIMLAKNAPY